MAHKNLSILIAGESCAVTNLILKGSRAYMTGTYEEGQKPIVNALLSKGHDVTYMRNHDATLSFPSSQEELRTYDVVILSDIGADTLLLHPDTVLRSKVTPNRLTLLEEYVRGGGGLLMIGGYMSFAGLDGMARYANTPLASVLPVLVYPYDDRIETPEGASPQVLDGRHPVTSSLPKKFPAFLGYNKVVAKVDATVLMKIRDDPFLVLGESGQGRTSAFTSDCSPHWATNEFTSSDFYPKLWDALCLWLAGILN